MDCQSVRQTLDERIIDPAAEAHLEACSGCATVRRVSTALRTALVVEAPPEVSARLLALAMPAPEPARLDAALKSALVVPVPPDLSRRLDLLVAGPVPVPARRPWLMPVYAATALLLGILLFFAAQVYGVVLQQLGVSELWGSAAQLPGQWLQQLYTYFPQGHYVVDVFWSLQGALQWVLVGLLMWAVLEMRRPPQRARSVA
jgi:hypothetical protein